MDERGITPVIPNRCNRKQPFSFSKRLYKLREQSARKQATEMGEPRAERRLAAMFAGDGAGYSRLMGTDEESTRARLNAHRREFLEPKIAEHRGRIVSEAPMPL